MLLSHSLSSYWSGAVIESNLLVLMHLLGAWGLGLLVGYERSYHGRAAGMRTYGLVCMASAALAVLGAYSEFWYGGNAGPVFTNGDLSRVIQGILTGLGFLCGGVIIKEGFTISGLTSAASLWTVSVIGILVGVGLYPAAIAMAALSAISMMWVSKIEEWLPSRQALAVTLRFEPGFEPQDSALRHMANARNYDIINGSVVIAMQDGGYTWSLIAVARSRQKMTPLPELGAEIGKLPGVKSFNLAYARN